MDLKEYIRVTGLTYRDLAKLFNCHVSEVHRYAMGKNKPRKKRREMITKKTHGVVTFKEDSCDNSINTGKANPLQTPKGKF